MVFIFRFVLVSSIPLHGNLEKWAFTVFQRFLVEFLRLKTDLLGKLAPIQVFMND